MRRMGMVLGLKADKVDEYRRIHADVWPEILEQISRSNIRNYTIFLKEPENLLFAYWEYHGDDFEADAARMADNPRMQDWWAICGPMQQPLETRRPGEWWAVMEPVFHHD
jgi:L-rhamnose mutarotase